MNFTFQIGLLPRAGSAWMATLLNMHQGVFCFHDALSSFPGKYLDAPGSKPGYDHVGDSSSYCCMRPHVERSVFIYRNPSECYESLDALRLAEDFPVVCKLADEWSDGCVTFLFEDIFGEDEDKSVETLKRVFDIVVPGVTLEVDKVRMLRPLKVELLKNGPEAFDIEEIKRRLPQCQ